MVPPRVGVPVALRPGAVEKKGRGFGFSVKVRDKLDLIDRVGRALQSKYSYADIDSFLSEFKVPPPPEDKVTSNSKWIYSKTALVASMTKF
jgi:hypothetical protein